MFRDLHFAIQKIRTGLSLLTIAGNCLYAQQWENVGGVQDVSAGGSSFNNLVIDNSGNYYLSYYDVSVTKGSVQKFNGSAWSYLGGSPGVTTGTATYNSLSISPNGSSIYYTNQIGYPGSGMEVRQHPPLLGQRSAARALPGDAVRSTGRIDRRREFSDRSGDPRGPPRGDRRRWPRHPPPRGPPGPGGG